MAADLILRDARIFTADRQAPWAEALAVSDGTIVFVGSSEAALAHRGNATEVRSLGGAFVMPGIVDGHNHPALAGRTALFELALPEGLGYEELLGLVRERAAQLAPGAWIVGAGWPVGMLDRLSTSEALRDFDEASGGHPAVLVDDSRHNRWANSAAMEIAGVPDGAGVLRDAEGRATGVLLERAGLPVAFAAAREDGLSDEQEREAYRHSLEILHGYGITAFQDAGATPEILRALHGLDAAGRLEAWVVTSLLMNDEVLGAEVVGAPLLDRAEAYRSTHHRPDFVKIFLDGIPPARTAAMLEPYLEDAHHGCGFCGSTILTPDELSEALRAAADRGLGAKIHSTGDATTRLILDTVERLREEGRSIRCQVAHGQYVAETDVPRFAELDVAADISPYVWYPGPVPDAIKTAVPAERAERIHPNRDLVDAGVLVSAGSDWPVSPVPNPWQALAGLVTRRDPTGQYPGELWPEQALSLEEALEVLTVNGARMIGVDDVTGTLTPGRSADFILLDRDPFSLDVAELGSLAVTETWFAGRRVFAR
ncbi:amidohydrolase [Leucobacter sp. CSA1]|uniref:Amidohydrolase n=1 Tax=Leucobacter chromiisoli TaxID=2796471 RepID=A0A934UW84_9MICO|nr:amidohydrolase [Leucobacter chromiisoli]MBK0420003.1 amidohydrolase [Leucobacter chromiisoli]